MTNECGLSVKLQEFGCPFVDDTPWVQSQSGEFFMSPEGTVTAAFWLPCVVSGGKQVPPGTCGFCASVGTDRQSNEPSSSPSGT